MESYDELYSFQESLDNLMLAKIAYDFGVLPEKMSTIYVDYTYQTSVTTDVFHDILAEAFEIAERYSFYNEKEDVFYWLGETEIDELRNKHGSTIEFELTVILDDQISLKTGDILNTVIPSDEGDVELYMRSIDGGILLIAVEDYGFQASCYVNALHQILPLSKEEEQKWK